MSSATPVGDFGDLVVLIQDEVATIRMLPAGDEQYKRHSGAIPKYFPKHKEIGEALHLLRQDDGVRVIVLTGTGDTFFAPPSTSPGGGKGHGPEGDWQLSLGLAQTLQAMIECEKPIVARVNGDAVSFGSSLVFASDFVVAVEDALIADAHLGMGDVPYGRSDAGVVPGDGGSVFVPLALPPCLAKEYLLLGRSLDARDLAARGVFNRAVPRESLDAAVDEMTSALRRRPHYALAWGKRVLTRSAAEAYARTFDAAWGYEMVTFFMNRELAPEQ